jgi:anti-sigma B factor antagonist
VIADQHHRSSQSRSRRRQTALIGAGSAGQRQGKQSLTVTVLPSCDEGVLVLRVAGEVDLATVGQLREHLHKHLPGTRRGVVLDCTEVSFLAACGIGLLVEIADQTFVEGMALRLVAQNRVVLRALEVTRATELVPLAATVAEAMVQCST